VDELAKIERLRLKIIGTSCATCIIPIRKNLEKANGIHYIGANYITDLIIVDYDTETISIMEIIQLIGKAGYRAMQMN
jgi:copper chaperone CopZ